MPLKPRLQVEIPNCSIPSWLFGSPHAILPDGPIALDPQDPGKFLTLSTYRRSAQRFAAGLRSHGFRTGDSLLYVSGNSLAFFPVYMGTLMAGGIFSGANPNMTVSQITYQAKDAKCRFVLSSSHAYDKCVEALKEADVPAKVVYTVDCDPLFDSPRQHATNLDRNWSELLGPESQGEGFDWAQHCADPEQLAALNYTSGSTGPPKGVMTSHRSLVASAAQWIRLQHDDPDTPVPSWVGFMPMIYIFGQVYFLLIGPKRGIRNYLMTAFDLDSMVLFIEKYRATELYGTPATAIGMVNSTVAHKADLTCLTSVQIGGAPLKQPVCERLVSLIGRPDMFIKQGWGMTELSGLALSRHPRDKSRSISVGELLPNCEGKVLSIDGKSELGPNERGEIMIRAPIIAQGYLNRPEVTQKTFQRDGWLRTGDLGYYNDDGRWFVIDRLRELIVTSKGDQIIPSEIESMILDIPGVVDAGVLSVNVDRGEQAIQEPRAYVVLNPNTDNTAADVERILKESLPESQQMTAGVFAINEIPKLPGSKIDRVALRKIQVSSA